MTVMLSQPAVTKQRNNPIQMLQFISIDNTQKETPSINKPIYDSLVLYFWHICDENKWTKSGDLFFCDNLEYILPISIFQETEETQCLAEICPTLVA